MELRPQEVINGLTRKSFRREDSGDVHLIFYNPLNSERTSIRTKVSHGRKRIGNNRLDKMAKQVELDTREQFYDLVNCPMSLQDYVNILSEKGKLKD
jgi:hypothetical protein